MRLSWYGEEVRHVIEAGMRRNLEKAALFVETEAKRNARSGGPAGFKSSRGGAGLVGTITHEVKYPVARIGTNIKYGRIHELGGTIVPATAGALTVPLAREARKAKAKDFPDAFLLKLGSKAFIVQSVGRGKRAHLKFLYVLKDSVHMPARPYLRPALDNNIARIRELLGTPIRG